MTVHPPISRSRRGTRRRRALALVTTAFVGFAGASAMTDPVSAGIVPTIGLATAGNYSVLGATTVSNTNPSVLGQSVGLSPGTAVVGFPPGIVLAPATIEAANAVTLQAQLDLTTAYVDAAGRSVEFPNTNPDLVGLTLAPGVYAAASKAPLGLSGQLVLDGQGDPNAVFVFQTDSTLITSTGSTIALINGASECNVFWQVGSSATLASGSLFVGNILALTSITVESNVVVHGRALARTGAVTLDNDVFTAPSCVPSTDTAPTATAPTTPATTTPTTSAPKSPAGTATPSPGTTPGAPAATNAPVGGGGTAFGLPSGPTLPATGAASRSIVGLAAAVALCGVVTMIAVRRRRQT